MAYKLALLVASMAVATYAEPTLWACPGNENNLLQFINGSIPEVWNFPGVANWNFHAIRKVDMPLDLVMDFKLKKTAPYPYDVPCYLDQGSCIYEVCDPKYFTPAVCAAQPPVFAYAGFPYTYPFAAIAAAPQHCGCPLRAGEVNLQNMQWTLPELGGVKAVVQGDFEGQATFYGKSRPDIILGCVNMKFSVA